MFIYYFFGSREKIIFDRSNQFQGKVLISLTLHGISKLEVRQPLSKFRKVVHKINILSSSPNQLYPNCIH